MPGVGHFEDFPKGLSAERYLSLLLKKQQEQQEEQGDGEGGGGGDGGGDSGGGSTTKTAPAKTTAQQNASAAAQEPVRGGFRGEQSAAVEAAKANLSSGDTQQGLADKVQGQVGQAVFDSGYYDKPTSQTAPA